MPQPHRESLEETNNRNIHTRVLLRTLQLDRSSSQRSNPRIAHSAPHVQVSDYWLDQLTCVAITVSRLLPLQDSTALPCATGIRTVKPLLHKVKVLLCVTHGKGLMAINGRQNHICRGFFFWHTAKICHVLFWPTANKNLFDGHSTVMESLWCAMMARHMANVPLPEKEAFVLLQLVPVTLNPALMPILALCPRCHLVSILNTTLY